MKKIVIALALVILALVGLIFLLPLALGSDMLRTALARQLSEASGAEVSFGGPIHFSVLPDFGIVVEDLGYVSGDGALEVAAERSVASVNPLTLLSPQVQITGIELRNPRIVLAEAAAGDVSSDEPAVSPGPQPEEGGDIFKMLAGTLERLSIDQLEVIEGVVAQKRGAVIETVASGIDIRLSVPGIDQPASITASGLVNGGRMEMAAEIGSLRALLDRQPAGFSLSAAMEHPPHPLLADIGATGSIQLADDGSYRVSEGEIDSAGGTMRLDISYVPGDRPFAMARIDTDTLDYSDFQPAQTVETAAPDASEPEGNGGPDLSALKDFDADIEVRVGTMRAGEASASDVVLTARLQDGTLDSSLSASEVAGGSMAAGAVVNLASARPETSGTLSLAGIDLDSLKRLAGIQAPVSGQLSSNLSYAFYGLDIEAIRNSVNLSGDVSMAGGTIEVPQLGEAIGADATLIEAVEATARIENITQPLAVSGTARWRGETVAYSAALDMMNLLMAQPGTVAVDLQSGPVDARFSGTAGLAGNLSGQADITAASLSRALAWVGQNSGTPLGRFSFSGGIAASGEEITLSDAAIALDDTSVRGSLSVHTAGKTTINATLVADTLDFQALTGGASSPAQAPAGPSGTTAIDLSILRQIDADIRLEANQIGYGKVKAGPASAVLTVSEGVARLQIPEAGFYGGAASIDVTANGAADIPQVALAARVDEVDALPLLTDAVAFDRIEGTLAAELAVQGSGADTDKFARVLNGDVQLAFADGAVRGIDVAELINDLQSLIGNGYTEDTEAKTAFTELSLLLDIQDGVARTDDFRLLGPLVRMSGEGSVDIAAQTIDMRLDPRVVGSLDGQGGNFDVAGLGMPIVVEGPLTGPRIYPDLSGILANPQQALQALAGLGGNIDEIGPGVSDTIGGLRDTLEGNLEGAAEGAVNDLIDRIGGGQPGGGVDANAIFGGLFGQPQPSAPQNNDQGNAGVEPQPAPQPAPTETNEEPAARPAADAVPPLQNVPTPRPDPRGATPAAPAVPDIPTDALTEDLAVPPSPPDETVETPLDFIGNLIDQAQ